MLSLIWVSKFPERFADCGPSSAAVSYCTVALNTLQASNFLIPAIHLFADIFVAFQTCLLRHAAISRFDLDRLVIIIQRERK